MDVSQRAQIHLSDEETGVRSWDHRKLGLAALPVAGSTAQYQ